MIRGTVVGVEARVILQTQDRGKRYHAIETIVDTGFDGWLSLPPVLVADLDLRWKGEGRGMLADGSESRFDVYEAAVQWHGRARRISVYAIGSVPLIGMALLNGSEFNMQVRPRGAVTIKPFRSRRQPGG
jgi:clan AA aspartic protease